MTVRSAQAEWKGGLPAGSGHIAVESASFDTPYSFPSRFESGKGTNPEELMAASHAGCFSMALAFALTNAGHPPTRVHTTAKVHLHQSSGGFAIPKIELVTEADVPGIDEEKFQSIAADAKKNCPISKALAAVPEVTLEATLQA